MPGTVGKRIPGGIPKRVEPEYSVDIPWAVGTKPLTFAGKIYAPGEVVPAECIEAIPRIESWVRARRIVPLKT
jgi:hypothetical protein